MPCAVGFEQQFEVSNLLQQLFAHIRIAYEHAMAGEVSQLDPVVNIRTGAYSLLAALKLLMLHKLNAEGVVDERIACYAGLLLIGLAESSIDNESFAFGTHRRLALDSTDRDVPVDDSAPSRRLASS